MDARRNRRDKVVGMKIYVEGGGNTNLLKTKCRQGFFEFLKKAGFAGHMPRIVACGSRQDAYDAFSTAMENGAPAMLLVDSESIVEKTYQQGDPKDWKPWEHLKNRQEDHWEKPDNASEKDCHLMVQCMEAWFLTDRATLQRFLGQGFNPNALPSQQNQIESVNKQEVYQSLVRSTKKCKTKSKYNKTAILV